MPSKDLRPSGRTLRPAQNALLSAFCAAALTACLPSLAAAADKTWDGGGNNSNWTNGTNWVGDVAPSANDVLVFAGSTRPAATNTYATNTQFNGLNFASGAGAFTLSGNPIILGGNMTNASANLQTFSLAINLTNSIVIDTGAAGIQQSGTGAKLTGTNYSITKIGSGTLSLGSDNVGVTGDFIIAEGTVRSTATGISFGAGFSIMSNGVTAMAMTNAGAIAGQLGVKVANNATVTFNSTTNVGATTITTNTISGYFFGDTNNYGQGVTIIKTGSEVLRLSSSSTLNTNFGIVTSNTWRVDQGTLYANTDVSLGNSNNAIALNGGALQIGESLNVKRIITLSNVVGNALANTNAANYNIAGTITGSGGFSKTGSGTITLAGTNTHTGTTTVDAGVLVLSNGSAIADTGVVSLSDVAGAALSVATSETIGSLRGGGTTGGNVGIVSGRTLTVAETGSQTFAGVISNSGALAKSGAGTMILTGANTYSGATTISNGTLQVGNGTDAGSIGSTSAITNNGALVYNVGGGTRTNGAVISGNGTLTQNSSGGTLKLTGANTYSGATVISAGTLQIGDGTDAGSIGSTSAITNNGALVYNVGSGTRTNGAVISGNGTLTQNSSGGTLKLTGANTYNGATIISAGTLQIGDGGTTGSIASTSGVNNNGTLAYNRSDNLTAAYAIAGGGNVTKSGAGTLTLSGANSYSGGTLVSTGTLKGDTTSLQGAITNNAAAIFDTATNGTYAGVMSGTGALTKSGAGTLTLTATNTYNGATTVAAGKFAVNGAISNSAVTVQSGAALGGSGVVGSTTVLNGATIAPGNSPGALTINGDLTWNNGGNYDWEVLKLPSAGIAGTDWDLLSVSGTLNLTNLSGAPLFKINLYSGALAGWSTTGTYAWKILEAGNAISASYISSSYIGINTSNFTNDISGGLFALELRDNSKGLYLTYTGGGEPIPEPGTWAAAALLVATAGFLRWRKRCRFSV